MSFRLKHLAFTCLTLVYLLGAFCLSVAAPERAIAAKFGNSSTMDSEQSMLPCDHPNFVCRPAADHSAITSSTKNRDPSSLHEITSVAIAALDLPSGGTSGISNSDRLILFDSSQKIPIYIFKSVLTL